MSNLFYHFFDYMTLHPHVYSDTSSTEITEIVVQLLEL